MKIVPGGVCAPKGFRAGASMNSIKVSNKYDVAVIASEVDASIAGLFTTNKIKAAPVFYSQEVVSTGSARAIVVNSGNANACTGEQGLADARAMVETAGRILGTEPNKVAVASTGVIGVTLPMEKVLKGIEQAGAALTPENSHIAAEAIMTTDTFSKEIALELELGDKIVRIGGIAKGSGMIHPDMATMLAFITTDVVIAQELLHSALKEVVASSFNMISVDGDTSTNDMVLVLANGQAGNKEVALRDEDFAEFKRGLEFVCISLAKMIAKDGEGATKLIEVEVGGAKTLSDARKAARTIVSSNLTKAAFYGGDANWGRIICALGYSGADFNPERVEIYLGEVCVAKAGTGIAFSETEAKNVLAQADIKVRVELNQGAEKAVAWGCDLSHEYVTINGSYRT